MVKIVGIDESAIKKVTCKQCASRLEYTLSEVTYSHSTDWAGGTDSWNYITCPKCNKKVTVSGR